MLILGKHGTFHEHSEVLTQVTSIQWCFGLTTQGIPLAAQKDVLTWLSGNIFMPLPYCLHARFLLPSRSRPLRHKANDTSTISGVKNCEGTAISAWQANMCAHSTISFREPDAKREGKLGLHHSKQ